MLGFKIQNFNFCLTKGGSTETSPKPIGPDRFDSSLS
jgi:hypothetical protein